jgi:hypothetical protein
MPVEGLTTMRNAADSRLAKQALSQLSYGPAG